MKTLKLTRIPAKPLDVSRRAVPEPAVELRLILQLLPPEARDGDEARSDFRERGHAPQSFSNHAKRILI